MSRVRRLQFLVTACLFALLTAPLFATAQQTRSVIPRIGVLWPNPPQTFEALRQGLGDLGYIEGKNVSFEYRWAGNRLDQLGAMATDLVQLKVDVIVCLAPPAAFAAKRATQSIPIVFVAIGDPLANGLVTSLAHPGGNLTGTTRMLSEMSAKNLALLKEAVPSLTRVAVLWNPANSSHATALKEIDAAARSLSLQLRPMEVRAPTEFEGVFAAISQEHADGILLVADPLFFIHLKSIVDLAAAKRLPTATNWTELPETGGLLGYATSLSDEYRRAASYVDKILKGAKPADLPVEQPTKFELVINLKTAKALGLTIPQSFLARADRVIE